MVVHKCASARLVCSRSQQGKVIHEHDVKTKSDANPNPHKTVDEVMVSEQKGQARLRTNQIWTSSPLRHSATCNAVY